MVPIVGGIPQPPVTVLFEVKNIREWIYPNALELYQVLHKGVILQQANPTVPIVPILICRAAQITAIYMAQALGFLIIEMGTQYVGHQVEERLFNEVRTGLHFMDMRLGEATSLRVRDRLLKYPPHVNRYATRWAETALDTELATLITQLHRRRHSARSRANLMSELRLRNEQLGRPGGW